MDITFLLNGEPVSLTRRSPTTTLLDWLREERGLTGTKEGCNEGDCGACTVMITDADGSTRAERLHPVSAAGARQTRHNVEGLQRARRHPAPRAASNDRPPRQPMRVLHAGLCGLHGRAHLNGATDHDTQLAGNLCRCTGYAPIIRAAQATEASRFPNISSFWPKISRGAAGRGQRPHSTAPQPR